MMQRNGRIFDNESQGVGWWRILLKNDFKIVGHRMKQKNLNCLKTWIDVHLWFCSSEIICYVLIIFLHDTVKMNCMVSFVFFLLLFVDFKYLLVETKILGLLIFKSTGLVHIQICNFLIITWLKKKVMAQIQICPLTSGANCTTTCLLVITGLRGYLISQELLQKSIWTLWRSMHSVEKYTVCNFSFQYLILLERG